MNIFIKTSTNVSLLFSFRSLPVPFLVIWLIEVCLVSMVHTPLPSTSLVMILETRPLFSENRSTVLREPEHTQAGEPEHISVGARFSENRSTHKLENRRASQLEHSSPRTRARFSENRSAVLREPEHTQAGELEHISMFSIFYAFSMFSTCSELTPRAPIPDGRMERFMHPWISMSIPIFNILWSHLYWPDCLEDEEKNYPRWIVGWMGWVWMGKSSSLEVRVIKFALIVSHIFVSKCHNLPIHPLCSWENICEWPHDLNLLLSQ